MKKIECIIRPFKLSDVKDALAKAGVQGMTVIEVKRFGRQKGHTYGDKAFTITIEPLPKIKIEVVVPDEKVEEIVASVMQAAYTGRVGDGKVLVLPIEEAVRVRTGERGKAATSF